MARGLIPVSKEDRKSANQNFQKNLHNQKKLTNRYRLTAGVGGTAGFAGFLRDGSASGGEGDCNHLCQK